MRHAIFALLLTVIGCHPQPPPSPPPPPPIVADIPACTLPVAPTSHDVCDAMFTVKAQIPCVLCGVNGQGCYDKADGVYCVKGACLTDAACRRFDPPDASYP